MRGGKGGKGGRGGGAGQPGVVDGLRVWLGFEGWVGLGCVGLGTLGVLFWSRERARSRSMVVW